MTADHAGDETLARLFVAVFPTGSTVDVLSRLPRPDQSGVRWVPPENWHVTLRFFGRADPSLASERLASLSLPRASATVGPVIRRLGRDAVVVPVAGLEPLAATLAEATADIGQPIAGRAFRGHLTLARVRQRTVCSVVGARCASTFAVNEVALVRSTLSRDGADYDVLVRYPTTG